MQKCQCQNCAAGPPADCLMHGHSRCPCPMCEEGRRRIGAVGRMAVDDIGPEKTAPLLERLRRAWAALRGEG